MASIVRPSLLRQTIVPTSTSRIYFRCRFSSTSKALRPCFLPYVLPATQAARSVPARVAAFHASSRKAILPPGAQTIEGTVNDAARVPEPSPTHGSYHWTFERFASAALIPLTIAPFASGSLNPVLDATLCATILIHSHIGFQSCIIDYVPQKRLPKTRQAFWWALRAATLITAIGLYEFETNDVGLTEAIKRIWTAKQESAKIDEFAYRS